MSDPGAPRQHPDYGAFEACAATRKTPRKERVDVVATGEGPGELDYVALQVADDAVVTILARLDQFRGESRFLTWARRITQHGVPSALTRSLSGSREFPIADGFEKGRMWPLPADGPYERSAARESAEMLIRLMADELTVRQLRVLIAVTVEEIEAGQLACRLGTNRGAIYKTLHDARRKLRPRLCDHTAQVAPQMWPETTSDGRP